MTADKDRERLLQIARAAIVSHVSGVRGPSDETAELNGPSHGAFVTIHLNGALRGCIGNLGTGLPLAGVVRDCAVAACSADPRFAPVAPAELPGLEIEISLLGPLESVASLEEIEVGRHGLVVEQGWHRGLLLPQVATEWGWDRETFLAQTCHKAGLARDAWKKGVKILRFEAEVFSEGGKGA